jgi:hypothetical protein
MISIFLKSPMENGQHLQQSWGFLAYSGHA